MSGQGEDFPVCVEKAKSSRSTCNSCYKAIAKNTLRIGQQWNIDHSGNLWYHPLCFKKYPPGKTAAEFLFGYEGLTAQEKEEIDAVISGNPIKSFPKAKVAKPKSKKKDEEDYEDEQEEEKSEEDEENEDDFNFPVVPKKTKASKKPVAVKASPKKASKKVVVKAAVSKKTVSKKAPPKPVAVKASPKKASKMERFTNKVPSTDSKIILEKKPPSFLPNNNNNQNAMKGIPSFPISTFQNTVPQTALPSMSSEAFFQNCHSDKPCLLDQLINSVSNMDSSVVISDLIRSKDLDNDLAMWFLYAVPVRTDVAEVFNAALKVYSCNKDKNGFVHTLSCIHSTYFD